MTGAGVPTRSYTAHFHITSTCAAARSQIAAASRPGRGASTHVRKKLGSSSTLPAFFFVPLLAVSVAAAGGAPAAVADVMLACISAAVAGSPLLASCPGDAALPDPTPLLMLKLLATPLLLLRCPQSCLLCPDFSGWPATAAAFAELYAGTCWLPVLQVRAGRGCGSCSSSLHVEGGAAVCSMRFPWGLQRQQCPTGKAAWCC